MLDEKGNFYIIDAVLAVILLLIVFLALNTAISIPSPDYSYETKDIRTAQDIMEILSGKVNVTDRTFIGDISSVLSEKKDSKEAILEVSKMSEDKLDSYNLENYRFCENNVLDGQVLASSGDYSKAGSVSVASRAYGDYYYTLYVW
jgi:hypothetical protein